MNNPRALRTRCLRGFGGRGLQSQKSRLQRGLFPTTTGDFANWKLCGGHRPAGPSEVAWLLRVAAGERRALPKPRAWNLWADSPLRGAALQLWGLGGNLDRWIERATPKEASDEIEGDSEGQEDM